MKQGKICISTCTCIETLWKQFHKKSNTETNRKEFRCNQCCSELTTFVNKKNRLYNDQTNVLCVVCIKNGCEKEEESMAKVGTKQFCTKCENVSSFNNK